MIRDHKSQSNKEENRNIKTKFVTWPTGFSKTGIHGPGPPGCSNPLKSGKQFVCQAVHQLDPYSSKGTRKERKKKKALFKLDRFKHSYNLQ